MTADGSIVIQVRLDSQAAIRGASTLESHFEKVGQKISRIGRILGSVFAVQQLVRFGKAAIELGSDLEEVQNVVDVTFGSLNSEINEFAKNAVTQFGLSELSAKQFTSTMGAMLKSMGLSTREAADMGMAITGLAGDMASFYNLDQEEAFYKIRSGISGEIEPLRQLGINLSVANLEQFALTQGITKSYNAMTQQEQALLRYNYLLSVTADAQGDFARTSDSWANQTRILSEQFNSLKASIGQGLISAFTPVLRWINTIIAGLQTVANVFRQVMALLFGKTTSSGAGAVQKSVSQVAGGFGAAADGAQSLAEGVGAAAAGAQELAKNTAAARKEAEKAILPFDTLTILHDNSTGSGGGGGGKGGGISVGGVGGIDLGDLGPDAAPIEDVISPQIQAIVNKILYYLEPLKGISFEPLKASLSRLKTAFSELGKTIGGALERAWFNILVPLAKWTIEDFAPDSVDLLTSAISALNDILVALKPFGEWLWNDFLTPIATWASEKLAPASLELFTSALGALNDILEVLKPYGQWLWDDFLQPIIEWTGQTAGVVIIDVLSDLSDSLTKIGDWAKTHKRTVALMALAAASFAAAWTLVNGAIAIWNGIAGLATTLTTAFGSAVAFLTSPIGLVTLAIAALIFGCVLLVRNWDKVKEAAKKAWDAIVEVWGPTAEWFQANVVDPIISAMDMLKESLYGIQEQRKNTTQEIAEYLMTALSENTYSPEQFSKFLSDKVVSGEWHFTDVRNTLNEIFSGMEVDGMRVDMEQIGIDSSGGLIDGIISTKGDVSDSVEELVKESIIAKAKEILEVEDPKQIGEAVTDGVADGLSGFEAKLGPWQQSYSSFIQSAVAEAQRGASEIEAAFNSISLQSMYGIGKTPGYMPGTSFVPHMPRITNLPIPHLAKGTVIPPRAPFLAVLGDQRNGTNVEVPLSTIQEAVANVFPMRELLAVMQEGNSLSRDLLYAVSNIDDAKIGKMANRYNRGLDRAYGR